MFDSIFRSWHSCIVIAGAVLIGPVAVADTPSGIDTTTSTIRSLHLDRNELTSSMLGNIRGGFEITPNLTINFGFSQIDSLGQNVIQSIIVPMTTLTNAQNNVTPVISGGSTTHVQSSPSTVSITSTANQGQTTVLTELGSNGVTNLIQNQASNQLIQQVTSISIGISGMSKWLSQQRGNASIVNGLSVP